jgi:hypothetical protein
MILNTVGGKTSIDVYIDQYLHIGAIKAGNLFRLIVYISLIYGKLP